MMHVYEVNAQYIATLSLIEFQKRLAAKEIKRTILIEEDGDTPGTVCVKYSPTDVHLTVHDKVDGGSTPKELMNDLCVKVEELAGLLATSAMLSCESPTIQFLRMIAVDSTIGIKSAAACDDKGPLKASVRVTMGYDTREFKGLLRMECMVRPKAVN